MKRKSTFLAVLVGVALIFAGSSAWALTLGFSNITGNSATNAEIGETQLFVEILGFLDYATFEFTNNGPDDSSITQIYFDDLDPTLFVNPSILDQSSGVSFKVSTGNLNLPGGNPISFGEDYGVEPTSAGGVQPNGINPGEWLKVKLVYQGSDFSTLESALDSGAFRIGFHVQGFPDGGSESFVNGPPTGDPGGPGGPGDPGNPVPEPGTIVLLGLGLVGLAGYRKYKK